MIKMYSVIVFGLISLERGGFASDNLCHKTIMQNEKLRTSSSEDGTRKILQGLEVKSGESKKELCIALKDHVKNFPFLGNKDTIPKVEKLLSDVEYFKHGGILFREDTNVSKEVDMDLIEDAFFALKDDYNVIQKIVDFNCDTKDFDLRKEMEAHLNSLTEEILMDSQLRLNKDSNEIKFSRVELQIRCFDMIISEIRNYLISELIQYNKRSDARIGAKLGMYETQQKLKTFLDDNENFMDQIQSERMSFQSKMLRFHFEKWSKRIKPIQDDFNDLKELYEDEIFADIKRELINLKREGSNGEFQFSALLRLCAVENKDQLLSKIKNDKNLLSDVSKYLSDYQYQRHLGDFRETGGNERKVRGSSSSPEDMGSSNSTRRLFSKRDKSLSPKPKSNKVTHDHNHETPNKRRSTESYDDQKKARSRHSKSYTESSFQLPKASSRITNSQKPTSLELTDKQKESPRKSSSPRKASSPRKHSPNSESLQRDEGKEISDYKGAKRSKNALNPLKKSS